MKKMLFLSLLIIFIGIVALSVKYYDLYDESIAYEFYQNTFIDTSHENSSIKVEYPQLKNNDKVNIIIKNFVESLAINIYGKDYTDLNLAFSYEVVYNKDDLISIVFKGLGDLKNMPYSNNLLFTLNIDIANLSIISFNDIYYINENVISIIKSDFHEQLVPEKFGYTIYDKEYEKIKESLLKTGSNVEKTIFENSSFYFTDDLICIRSDTYNALGDYFVIEIGYKELQSYIKIDKKPFK